MVLILQLKQRRAGLMFVIQEVPRWLHVDTGAWVSGGACGAGRPEGGEALALRALWSFIQQRYSSTGTRAT